jgi:hypothetical protein
MEQKIDLLTKEPFIPKRRNQLFATARNRINYNNEKARKIREDRATIDRPLHTNYSILCELMGGKEEQVFSKDFLIGKGLDFKVHTHLEKFEGKLQYAVYQFIIFPINDLQVKIVKVHGIK